MASQPGGASNPIQNPRILHAQNESGKKALRSVVVYSWRSRFGHGCSGHRMLLEHERNYDLGMDALVTVCSWNTNGIMIWAWMLWSPYALGTRTEL